MKQYFTQKGIFVVLALTVVTAYASAASWVPAPCNDPSGCNAVPPIHEGAESQIKAGGLSLLTLGVRTGATAGYVLTAKDANGTAEWKPAGGGSICTSWTCMKETYYVVRTLSEQDQAQRNWGLSPRAPNVTIVEVAPNQKDYKTAAHFSCSLAGMGITTQTSPACRVSRTQNGTFQISHTAHDCLIVCTDY